MESTIKIAADKMLGKLAKWLRVCGLDVFYSNSINFPELIAKAKAEKRVVLTRDTKIFEVREYVETIFIKHDHLSKQMKQFFEENEDLDPLERAYTRCLECNAPLEKIEKEKIKGKVWPYVYKTQDSFNMCPKCKKIFWPATHRKNMEKSLENMLS